MVRIEYAADLLAASGIGDFGIDPYLTSLFERQAREHPALAQPGPRASRSARVPQLTGQGTFGRGEREVGAELFGV
ncbi:hypothetical protein [Kitasatospora aureofaciens]|uniref:hypothetical protein n=1 Tax=Kitasatospora aureofaciens TaxID=1894 RepID=UPI0037C7A3F3